MIMHMKKLGLCLLILGMTVSVQQLDAQDKKARKEKYPPPPPPEPPAPPMVTMKAATSSAKGSCSALKQRRKYSGPGR